MSRVNGDFVYFLISRFDQYVRLDEIDQGKRQKFVWLRRVDDDTNSVRSKKMNELEIRPLVALSKTSS